MRHVGKLFISRFIVLSSFFMPLQVIVKGKELR